MRGRIGGFAGTVSRDAGGRRLFIAFGAGGTSALRCHGHHGVARPGDDELVFGLGIPVMVEVPFTQWRKRREAYWDAA
ncbi:hypothetical protein [Bradyrhizobium sp.]|uniref:hypothetical protein n=1 Tax=Bradyrhizobium sp. TaxID=376 RepID=UPI001D709869|nr:hypothetical protein [Bradyrhizobium sp.]MBV8701632.1 hypothetical protein [Bradyrhizobium sp.]MBV8919841.1 hypothetical protein [Bradyrhizobium sp.]MBV9980887.1 hypothetical protein [Bradyrhizobium sp.]